MIASMPLATTAAADRINGWADSVTHGLIAKILDQPLPDTTRLFLANAIYFKGKWLDQFAKSATRDRDFMLVSGRTVRVPMMERVGDYQYRRVPGYQLLRMPYRGGRSALYVLLPDSGVTTAALEARLAREGWPGSFGKERRAEVRVVLPRFEARVSSSLDKPLRALGAALAYDCARADFSGMARRVSGNTLPLCIGKATQTVYMRVDEEGTEAAAITGIPMETVTSEPPPPIPFIVDRPFLFVLRDEVTGADLFIGRIARP